MVTATVHRPAQLVHAFFAAERALTPGSVANDALHALWSRAKALGMDQEVAPHWSTELPAVGDMPYSERLTVLAARQEAVPGGFHQALAYRLHDTVGVSVLQAPNDDAIAWSDLHDYEVGASPGSGILGTATLYLGLWPDRERSRLHSTSPAMPAAIGRELRGLPPVGQDADWSGLWCSPARGLFVWELPARDHAAVPLSRRLLAIAGESDEDTLDAWLWMSAPGLAPFTRYLLHAAKLRYQHAVLKDALPELRDAIDATNAKCAELTGLLDDDMVAIDRLLAADRTLSRLQTDQRGLIALVTDVRDMTCTVGIAQDNMAAALDERHTCAPGGPTDNDRQSARWMREQLRAEETYLASAQTKATEIARITGVAVDTRLRQRRENLTLLQTTLLGSVLMVLAGIQSLQYRVPLPGPLIAPLVCVLGALALLLPSAILHWPRGGVEGGRWRWADVLFAAFLGGSVGWLVVTTGTYLEQARAASPEASALGALLGAVITAAFGLLRLRSR